MPFQDLHLMDGSPAIRFEDTDIPQTWDIVGNSSGFRIVDGNANVSRLLGRPG